MHPTHPSRRRTGAFTLIEMVVAISIAAIVFAAALFFAYPLVQATDVVVRAELTDMADNALQRIAREVRLALPNSVRVKTLGGVSYLEFIPLRTGGRYRAENSGLCSGAGSDALSFDAADDCFKSLGAIPNFAEVVGNGTGDFLVLNNFGNGFSGQNVYEASPANVQAIDTVTSNTVKLSSAKTFQRKLHDSPGRRFYIATPPVSFRCDPVGGTLTRHTGYTLQSSQPDSTLPAGASLATFVTACSFDYSEGVAPHVGLLTLRITLTKAVSTGSESVSLYNAIHVNNLP